MFSFHTVPAPLGPIRLCARLSTSRSVICMHITCPIPIPTPTPTMLLLPARLPKPSPGEGVMSEKKGGGVVSEGEGGRGDSDE